MLRVFRDTDGEWWAESVGPLGSLDAEALTTPLSGDAERVSSIDEFDNEVADRLAVLLHVEPGKHIEGVGRRISPHTFWLFNEGEDSWLVTADTAIKM